MARLRHCRLLEGNAPNWRNRLARVHTDPPPRRRLSQGSLARLFSPDPIRAPRPFPLLLRRSPSDPARQRSVTTQVTSTSDLHRSPAGTNPVVETAAPSTATGPLSVQYAGSRRTCGTSSSPWSSRRAPAAIHSARGELGCAPRGRGGAADRNGDGDRSTRCLSSGSRQPGCSGSRPTGASTESAGSPPLSSGQGA
jgi:hypothetical protein